MHEARRCFYMIQPLSASLLITHVGTQARVARERAAAAGGQARGGGAEESEDVLPANGPGDERAADESHEHEKEEPADTEIDSSQHQTPLEAHGLQHHTRTSTKPPEYPLLDTEGGEDEGDDDSRINRLLSDVLQSADGTQEQHDPEDDTFETSLRDTSSNSLLRRSPRQTTSSKHLSGMSNSADDVEPNASVLEPGDKLKPSSPGAVKAATAPYPMQTAVEYSEEEDVFELDRVSLRHEQKERQTKEAYDEQQQ